MHARILWPPGCYIPTWLHAGCSSWGACSICAFICSRPALALFTRTYRCRRLRNRRVVPAHIDFGPFPIPGSEARRGLRGRGLGLDLGTLPACLHKYTYIGVRTVSAACAVTYRSDDDENRKENGETKEERGRRKTRACIHTYRYVRIMLRIHMYALVCMCMCVRVRMSMRPI